MTGRHWLTEFFPLTRLSALVLYHCMKFVWSRRWEAWSNTQMRRPVWCKNPIWARKSLAVCIMQQAAKPSVECDWFGFSFVWLGPASEYFHCFEVADLRLRACLQTTIGLDLHLCGTVASSPVNNAYRSDGSLRRRPKLARRPLFAHLYGSAFVVLRGNSWESTLLNHRLS